MSQALKDAELLASSAAAKLRQASLEARGHLFMATRTPTQAHEAIPALKAAYAAAAQQLADLRAE